MAPDAIAAARRCLDWSVIFVADTRAAIDCLQVEAVAAFDERRDEFEDERLAVVETQVVRCTGLGLACPPAGGGPAGIPPAP